FDEDFTDEFEDEFTDEFDPEFMDAFEEDEDEEYPEPIMQRKWVRRVIGAVLAMVLLGNILAFWPQIYSLDAIRFLAKSRELSQNELIQQYKQAVAVVSAGKSKGTGFLIQATNTANTTHYIVTNHHVVEGEQAVLIEFNDG